MGNGDMVIFDLSTMPSPTFLTFVEYMSETVRYSFMFYCSTNHLLQIPSSTIFANLETAGGSRPTVAVETSADESLGLADPGTASGVQQPLTDDSLAIDGVLDSGGASTSTPIGAQGKRTPEPTVTPIIDDDSAIVDDDSAIDSSNKQVSF